MFYFRFLPSIGLIALGVASRLIPHPPNFTALNAIAFFGILSLATLRQSILTLLATLVLSDLILGFHETQLYVYTSYTIIALIGYWASSKQSTPLKLLSMTACSCLFFLITNFGSWLTSTFYSKTYAGLMLCYWNAIPFFSNQLLGDGMYSLFLIICLELSRRFCQSKESQFYQIS